MTCRIWAIQGTWVGVSTWSGQRDRGETMEPVAPEECQVGSPAHSKIQGLPYQVRCPWRIRSQFQYSRIYEHLFRFDCWSSSIFIDLHRSSSIFIDLLFKYSGAMPGEFAQLCSAGQAASTKAGSLPAPWVEELRDLQDELPISNYQDTPWHTATHTITYQFLPDSKTCCQKMRNMRVLSTWTRIWLWLWQAPDIWKIPASTRGGSWQVASSAFFQVASSLFAGSCADDQNRLGETFRRNFPWFWTTTHCVGECGSGLSKQLAIILLDMSKDCNQCLYIIYSVFFRFPCDLSQTTVAMMNSIGSCPRFSLPRKTSSLCRLTWHGSGALVRRPNQMGQQGDWRSVQVGTHTCTGIAHTHAPTYIYMYIYI